MKTSDNASSETTPQYTIDENVAAGEVTQLANKQFGTVFGVYLPTVLNILGVIMYLRLGWVVGNAGLGGTILIILTAYLITGTTALCISSIVTNIRLGAGGVFSIVSQSLGLEVGGSVGIQFYLAQTFASAMYIYGFMEAWKYLFPSHHAALVILGVYAVMVIVSYVSTGLAVRLQTIVMFGGVLALGCMFGGLLELPQLETPQFIGDFEYGSFWIMFAIFFPAATDVMVGSTLSGNLKKPRWSIPVGTLAAWGTTLLIYISLAVWYAVVASPEALKGNLTVAADKSIWNTGVTIGVLASCFNAGLSSLTVGPRVLQSLGQHRIVPFGNFFGRLQGNEPRSALLFTAALVLIALSAGDLNVLALFVTICFLLTYFTVNTILLIEQNLKMVSFRPSLPLPWWIPLFGSFACMSAILIISPFWGLVTILVSIGIYVYLNTKGLDTPWETIHGGVFVGIVNWAAKKVVRSTGKIGPRAWKPDLLLPIERRTQLDGYFRLLKSLLSPQGSVQVMAYLRDRDILPLIGLNQSISDLHQAGVFATASIIESSDYSTGLETTVDVLSGTLSRPNIIFVDIRDRSQDELQQTLEIAKKSKVGVVFYAVHPETILGKEQTLNLWIRDQSPRWHFSFNLSNLDLPLLLAYQLMTNWNADLKVLSRISEAQHLPVAQAYLEGLMEVTRMPKRYELQVEYGPFMPFLERAPRADLNIFGLSDKVDKENLLFIVQQVKSSCFFVLDSGNESALA